MISTIIITIAFLPAGPLAEAAANTVLAKTVRDGILKTLVDNAENLEKKFGSLGGTVANKAFDAVASGAIDKLVEKFDPAAAKKALEAGVGKLKDKSVKFAASSDEAKCVSSFLTALIKSANDSMHNLTDVIGSTQSYSEAIAFYNIFSNPLQASYEAAIDLQVDHMLRQLKDVLATKGEPQTTIEADGSWSTKTAMFVKVSLKNRKLLASVEKFDPPNSKTPVYRFNAWITPDMEPNAISLIAEDISYDQLTSYKPVPEPECEPGERVVSVSVGGQERLMLIDIEDEGFFWREYGVKRFKQWSEPGEVETVFRTRGATQIGGIDRLDASTIKGVPKS